MDLRRASADSLAELSTELNDSLRAGSHAEKVAGELFSVATILRAEPPLRRVATDASLEQQAKQGLVKQVFGDKVDDVTMSVLVSAVARRWTGTRDLPDALERLSEITLVRSVGDKAGQLGDEIFALSQMVTANPDLRDALSNPARSTEDKAALVDTLLDGKVLPATVTLVKQALAGTYRTMTGALENYRQIAATVQGAGVATVHVVHSLSHAERERLGSALSAQYGREIHLNEIVDPSVIGGMRVEIGDDVFDATVSSRLDDARRKLAG
jgi:F-type H+-transporting ATPase subunit delta